MKYTPRALGPAAEVSSGGGGRGMLREALILFGAFLALALATYFLIGWGMDRLLPLISPEREQRWFSGFSPPAELSGELPPELASRRAHAEALLRGLTTDPAVPQVKYRLVVIQGDAPNAFAIPGGTIGISRGLLELLDDDIALAFVLGHELGHFAQRDHLRGLGRRFGRALAWAILFGDGGDVVGQHFGELLDLNYSRGQEAGADLFGLELVHRVHGTTQNFDRLFAWLEQRETMPAWTAMLATHPQSKDRLKLLRDHAANLNSATRTHGSGASSVK